MAKFKEITSLYFETLKNVTKDKESWQKFLDCASSNFKYNLSSLYPFSEIFLANLRIVVLDTLHL